MNAFRSASIVGLMPADFAAFANSRSYVDFRPRQFSLQSDHRVRLERRGRASDAVLLSAISNRAVPDRAALQAHAAQLGRIVDYGLGFARFGILSAVPSPSAS